MEESRMRSEGKKTNFVFLDLSKLDAASAASFLADRAQRTGDEALSPADRCHWIVSALRAEDLMAAKGPGPDFLRTRLASGDRLFCTNPTGADWNHLFPSEAEQEIKTIETLSQAGLFLDNTPVAPEWIAEIQQPFFRAGAEGLWFHHAGQTLCFPWASGDGVRAGVCWIVPGQALWARLPAHPWSGLPTLSPLTDSKTTPAQTPSPEQKKAWYGVAVQRRALDGPQHRQAILFHSPDYPGLGVKEAVDFDEALGGIRKRSLVANMQGQTDLVEGTFKVRFQGGRLVHIEDSRTATVFCSGTESYLEWGGKRHNFVVNSAFSFEGDYSWGLRQSLVLRHEELEEPGRIIADYYFVEESREFFVALSVRWPRWKTPTIVTAWAPLELTLFDRPWTEPLTTRTLWPDGRSTDKLHRRDPSGILNGTDFVFSAGAKSLAFGFPQNQSPRPHALPWKLVPGWGKSRVVVNPEGGRGLVRNSEFEGIEEHFSFYLTPAEGAKLPFSVTRKQAIELIPPYVSDVSPS